VTVELLKLIPLVLFAVWGKIKARVLCYDLAATVHDRREPTA